MKDVLCVGDFVPADAGFRGCGVLIFCSRTGRGYALPAVEVPPAVGIKAFYHPLGRAYGIVPRTLVGPGHLSDFGCRVSQAFVSNRIRHSASNPLNDFPAGQMTVPAESK